MNFEELEKIVQEDTGVSICPICGTPYRKCHYRQKTCGTDECKKAWRSIYLKERSDRLKSKSAEDYRRYHRDAQRRYRRKKQRAKEADAYLKHVQEFWTRKEDRIIPVVDGLTYAERQIQKTLAQVPKIDLNIGEEDEK